MKLVNSYTISPTLSSFCLSILIGFNFLILIIILILFFSGISRVLIVIVLLTRLLPNLVIRRPCRFRKIWVIIFRSKIDLRLIFNRSFLMESFIWFNGRMCKRNSHAWFFSFKSIFLKLIIYLILVYWTTYPHSLVLLIPFLSLFTELSLVLSIYIPLTRRWSWVVKVWHLLFYNLFSF